MTFNIKIIFLVIMVYLPTNSHRLPDLIVGAPFYFDLDTGEGGAVYVYLNDPKNYLQDVTPLKLTGKWDSR